MTMHSDDRDELDNLPSLSMPSDDVMERARTSPSDAKKKEKSKRKRVTFTSFVKTGFFLVLLGLLVTVGGISYVQIAQLQRELASTQSLIVAAEQQLAEVSGVITEAGQALSQSDQQVKLELKELHSEIRKLWDLASKRNGKDISKLKAHLADSDASLVALKVLSGTTQGETKKYSDTLNKAMVRIERIERQIKGFNADFVVNLSTSREEIDMLLASVDGLRRDAAKVLVDVNVGMDQQIASVKETSRSMDSYRQQVNQRLLQLEDSLRQAQGGRKL
ncbi:MAG: hypothetical protein KAG53_05895 [Endozoicomonadaceae bacterium]|nr:hypothetical protein [Endozoicomonadaceae bacterium]